MRYTYPACFEPNELGGYSVTFPDLPDCYTDGDDLDDAANMAAEAMELVIESYIDNGRELPSPTFDVALPKACLLVAVSADVNADDKLVSAREAAQMLEVSDARVRQLIGNGSLVSKKQGRDNYVYLWSVRNRLATPRAAGRPRKAAMK